MAEVVPPERLPCPSCRSVTVVAPSEPPGRVEVVHCQRCGKLLRRRKPLTDRQHGEALALRWAAEQLEADSTVVVVQRRRKLRGTRDEDFARALLVAAERLRAWARTVHKRPPLREEPPA